MKLYNYQSVYLSILLGLSLILYNCSSSASKYPIHGNTGKLVVIVDTNKLSDGFKGAIHKFFEAEYPVLPSFEPLFDVTIIHKTSLNETYKHYPNIIEITIDTSAKDAFFEIRNNLWAEDQVVLKFTVPDQESFSYILSTKGREFVSLLENNTRKHIINEYSSFISVSLSDSLKKHHSVSLIIPQYYTMKYDTTDFAWISWENDEISSNLIFYTYNYSDSGTFTSQYLIDKRDEFVKKYIKGTDDSSYMITDTSYLVQLNQFSHGKMNDFVAELRGLWKLRNGLMSGPFVSISTLDKKNKRIVTLEGYLSAPRVAKRDLIREMEAILLTYELK